jgi:hypothetical protein
LYFIIDGLHLGIVGSAEYYANPHVIGIRDRAVFVGAIDIEFRRISAIDLDRSMKRRYGNGKVQINISSWPEVTIRLNSH